MQSLDGDTLVGSRGVLLLFQNGPRMVRSASKEKHKILLQIVQQLGGEIKGFYPSLSITLKADEVQTPKGSRILVLFSDVPP